jgi:hypothetical protein
MSRPTLYCDVCGTPMPDFSWVCCPGCKTVAPTPDSLEKAWLLNSPYWKWRAEEEEFARESAAHGFRIMGDGSAVRYESYSERAKLERIDAFHAGEPL